MEAVADGALCLHTHLVDTNARRNLKKKDKGGEKVCDSIRILTRERMEILPVKHECAWSFFQPGEAVY